MHVAASRPEHGRRFHETVQEWELWVWRACGDYALGGYEEVVHLPNHRCAGIKDPTLVERVPVVRKDLLRAVVRGPGIVRGALV